jgi:cytochrome c-type biogenesis protein
MIEYLVVFLAGLVSTISPCILPIIPVIFATSSGRLVGGFFVVLGMVTSFGIFGFIFGFISSFPILRYVSLVLLLFYSVHLMFNFSSNLNLNFNLSPSLNHKLKIFNKGSRISNAVSSKLFNLVESSLYPVFLGISLGLVWAPCIGPILGAVLTLVSLKANPFEGMVIMVVYAIGIGTMMTILMLLGSRSGVFRRFSDQERMNRVFGAIMFVFLVLIMTGIFDHLAVFLSEKLGFFEESVKSFLFT